jgi:hypothetical protein
MGLKHFVVVVVKIEMTKMQEFISNLSNAVAVIFIFLGSTGCSKLLQLC